MNQEEWIEANLPAVTAALMGASDELYGLLGGQVDRERQREELAKELQDLELKWRYSTS